MGADTKANTLGGGGALELLEHAVLLDAARDDDGGRDAEPLIREVNLLGRLRALELFDRKRVPVDTAKGREACCECQRALTERRTLSGGGALEVGNHRLLEDGCECGGALVSDVVATKTASEGRSEDGVREQPCQGALTQKRTLWGGGAPEVGDLCLL